MTDHSMPLPELAVLASTHPEYEFSRRYHSPGVVRYTARGDLTTHPYAVITHDLGELAAVLADVRQDGDS